MIIPNRLLPIIVFLLGAFLGARPLFDYDLYWHLANGREILATLRPVGHEVFSYTHGGETFLNRAWLAQAIWFLVWETFGPHGLLYFKIFVAGAVSFMVFVAGRQLGASLWLAAAMGPVAVLIGLVRYIERPELFSLLLTALVAALLLSWRAGKSPWMVLVPIPFIMVIWDWLHGGPYGFLYLAIFGVWANATRWIGWAGTVDPQASIRWLNAVLAITVFFSVANPWGLLTYFDVWSLIANPDRVAIKRIMEFNSSNWNNNPQFFVFLVLAAVSFAATLRRIGILGPVLSLAFAMGALEYVRATGAFAIVCAPFVAAAMSQLLGGALTMRRIAARGAVALVIIYWLVIAVQQKWPGPRNPHGLGFSIDEQYLPAGSVEFSKHLGLRGNLFNTGHFGGYLSFALYPHAKIFQYNLPSIFGDAYRFTQPAGLAELERWNIQYAFVANADELRIIFPNHAWARIYRDSAGVLVVRRNAEHQQIIDLFESKWFHPMYENSKLSELVVNPLVRRSLFTECVVYLAFRKDERIANWLLTQSGIAEVQSDRRYETYLALAKAKNPALNAS